MLHSNLTVEYKTNLNNQQNLRPDTEVWLYLTVAKNTYVPVQNEI